MMKLTFGPRGTWRLEWQRKLIKVTCSIFPDTERSWWKEKNTPGSLIKMQEKVNTAFSSPPLLLLYSLFSWSIWEPLKEPVKCGLSGMNKPRWDIFRLCLVGFLHLNKQFVVVPVIPPPLAKVDSNTRPCSKLGGAILIGGEGGGGCYISQICDKLKCSAILSKKGQFLAAVSQHFCRWL